MSDKPSQKIVLVTGCSSGFGMLTAARLAAEGHKVIATMRDLKKKAPLLDEVNRRGAKVDILPLDVTDKQSIAAAVAEIGSKYGYVDVLVNNAGFGIGGFFEDLSDEEIRSQFETNFFGVQNVCRAIIPFMRPRRSGKIINLSSVSGFNASPCLGAYVASKWALEGFSESLRYELKPFGIDVLLIEPGSYRTKIFSDNARFAAKFVDNTSPYFEYSQYFGKKVKESIADNHKDPEDIAKLVSDLINAENPPFRNIPDLGSKFIAILRRILPFRIYSAIEYYLIYSDFKQPEK